MKNTKLRDAGIMKLTKTVRLEKCVILHTVMLSLEKLMILWTLSSWQLLINSNNLKTAIKKTHKTEILTKMVCTETKCMAWVNNKISEEEEVVSTEVDSEEGTTSEEEVVVDLKANSVDKASVVAEANIKPWFANSFSRVS